MARLNPYENPDAILGMVFSHPSLLDVTEGQPLSTGAGRYLKHSLYDAGLKPSEAFVDYLMPSFPGRRGLATIEAQQEISDYLPELRQHLADSPNLKVLLLFGQDVCNAFGIPDSLTKTRGFIFDHKKVIMIPTYDPNYLFKGNGAEEVTFLNDLQKAVEIAKNGFERPVENFMLGPTFKDVQQFFRTTHSTEKLYVDIEAIGSLNERDRNEITMIGIGRQKDKKVIVIPFITQGHYGYWEDEEEKVRRLLQKKLSTHPCVFHNAEYDVKHLNYQGFGPINIGGDTMLLHHLISPELKHSLDYVTSIYGNIPYWKATLKNAKDQMAIDNEKLWLYNARDVLATMQIEAELLKEAEEMEVLKIYNGISLPMLDIVLEFNNNGIPVNGTKLATWRENLSHRNTQLLDAMPQLWEIHNAFNWDSGQHLAWLFYGQEPAGLQKKKAEYAEYFVEGNKKKKNTKKFRTLETYIEIFRDTRPFRRLSGLNVKQTASRKVSTDDEMRVRIQKAIIDRQSALLNMKRKTEAHKEEEVELAAMRQIIDNMIEYAMNNKLLTTYTKLHIEPDGCVHPGYKVFGTKTGRLSSYSPNAQNQPPGAKKIFETPDGWVFIQFDFTNLELVVLAYFADIPYLIDVFQQGKNVHDENTRRFLGLDKSDPRWDSYRRVMKMYVFGRNYGGGLKGMYRRILTAIPGIQMTFKEFEELDKNYFELMPEYKEWYYATIDEVKRTRMLRNAFGRLRIFLNQIDKVEREALNFPIQSTAADIMAYGLVDLFKRYRKAKEKGLKMQLNLSVHDSVVMLVPEREILVAIKMLKKSMCKPLQIGQHMVSFTGDLKIMNDLKGKKEDEKNIDEWLEEYERRKTNKQNK